MVRRNFPPRWGHRFEGLPARSVNPHPPRWAHRYKGVRPRNRWTMGYSWAQLARRAGVARDVAKPPPG